jgi:hypothetical protein
LNSSIIYIISNEEVGAETALGDGVEEDFGEEY